MAVGGGQQAVSKKKIKIFSRMLGCVGKRGILRVPGTSWDRCKVLEYCPKIYSQMTNGSNSE